MNLPGYWKLTPEQKSILKKAVAGREIWDMGAGNGSLATHCIQLGAKSVFAVEYQIPAIHQTDPNLVWINSLFAEMTVEPRELMLISWPWEKTTRDDLVELAKMAQHIVVLANTTGGTQCGSPQMWEFLKTLKVTAYCTDLKNDLIVYENILETRKELPTETAGMDMEKIHSHTPYPTINLLEPCPPKPQRLKKTT